MALTRETPFTNLTTLVLVWLCAQCLCGTFGCSPSSSTVENVHIGMQSDELQEVCFDGLGCFNNSIRCHRSGFPPSQPHVIDTRFFLFTRANRTSADQLDDGDSDTFRRFDPMTDTKVVIHGYTDSYEAGHIVSIKDALLLADDVNVIMVDWSGGARRSYPTSRTNIRVVGRQTARLLLYLRNEFPSMGNVHIIGHSLGAHAAGYVGEETGFIDRITGLDPAGPLFNHESEGCRLDPTDASFVDVIHTNGHYLGLGLMDQLGHHDFYPNGGKIMPGCGSISVLCHHLRSIEYFIYSIRNRGRCSFDGSRCSSWEDFTSDLCETDCGDEEACSGMGYYVRKNRPTGKYFLRTTSYKPYC